MKMINKTKKCTVLMLLGVKESARLNKAMTAVNILIAAFIVISGSFRLNSDNWRVTVMISSSNIIIFNQIEREIKF